MRVTYINTKAKKKTTSNKFNFNSKKSNSRRFSKQKSQSGLFGYSPNSVLQFLTLTVIACFGILLLPNLISENTPIASASSPKRIQIVSNIATTTSTNNQAVTQIAELVANPIITESSTSSSEITSGSKIIANPDFAASNKTYKVSKGETLATISSKLNLDPVELAIINGLKSSKVEVGMELKLP